jgi:hypothetical protein
MPKWVIDRIREPADELASFSGLVAPDVLPGFLHSDRRRRRERGIGFDSFMQA